MNCHSHFINVDTSDILLIISKLSYKDVVVHIPVFLVDVIGVFNEEENFFIEDD